MQKMSWYWNRLNSMSLPEILWRIKSKSIDIIDSIRIPLGLYPSPNNIAKQRDAQPSFSVLTHSESDSPSSSGYDDAWRTELLAYADDLLSNKHTFFDFISKNLGSDVNWNYDYNLELDTQRGLSQWIDYRDVARNGDCKLVWEPNRHHHLVVLARAYFITKDERYAEKVVEQILSWDRKNPFGHGMNWRSPLELGIRLINWVWSYDMVKNSKAVTNDIRERIIYLAYLMIWETARKYSMGSSANNHLIGEVAGVFIAASYFNRLPDSHSLISQSKQVLEQEILKQTFSDGCTKEHALGYEFFVLHFYILCGLVGQWTGNEFSDNYWSTISRMLHFIGDLTEANSVLPMFGDCDDGYVLDVGIDKRNPHYLLCIGAIYFKDARLKYLAKTYQEPAFWLFGEKGFEIYRSIPDLSPQQLSSRAYEDSKYYLLQAGDSDNSISCFIDSAELGYGPIAAHGNADALSFTLSVNGRPILVDPGTYDYFTYIDWRDYFRSTLAHNTICVDNINQSEIKGHFLWGERASTTVHKWKTCDHGGEIEVSHDGYMRLADPVMHIRSMSLNYHSKALLIIDKLKSVDKHNGKIAFHFHPDCVVSLKDNVLVARNGAQVVFELGNNDGIHWKVYHGSEEPKLGWYSDGYHKRVPTTTLIGEFNFAGEFSMETVIRY